MLTGYSSLLLTCLNSFNPLSTLWKLVIGPKEQRISELPKLLEAEVTVNPDILVAEPILPGTVLKSLHVRLVMALNGVIWPAFTAQEVKKWQILLLRQAICTIA